MPQQMRGEVMRKLAIVIVPVLVLVLLFGGIGCFIEGEEPTPEPSPANYIYTNGIIEVGGDGEPIELINNPNATDPTYARLVSFIEQDPTDRYSYIFGPPKAAYVCSDFAEDVHNNAEAAGIRAAWVGIDILGDSEGHALNAFRTTDVGLVYIDCTGEGLWSMSRSQSGSWDKRAYVKIGKQYGVKVITEAKSSFHFLIYLGGPIVSSLVWNPGLNADKVIYTEDPAVHEWLESHDEVGLGLDLIQGWLQEHESDLYRCGLDVELINTMHLFDERNRCLHGSFGIDHPDNWWYCLIGGLGIDIDCIDVPWFKPLKEVQLSCLDNAEVELVEVDGINVEMGVKWRGIDWDEPLGTVEHIHKHW